jgi:GT2 family glycosyltransferase
VLHDLSDFSPEPARILQGCAILISRQAFEQVGGFDESIVAGEDTLLYEALKKERYNVMFDPRLSVVHMGYPDTLRAFTYRQFWHASDYIRSNKGLFNDLTYLGTWASVLFLLAFVICLPFSPLLSAMLVMIWAILPLLLSLKRLKKANWPRLTPLKFVQVYLLDVCYLLGRTLGLLKSLLSKDSSI